MLKLIDGFSTPVVALTADAKTGAKEKYQNLGFSNYISNVGRLTVYRHIIYTILVHRFHNIVFLIFVPQSKIKNSYISDFTNTDTLIKNYITNIKHLTPLLSSAAKFYLNLYIYFTTKHTGLSYACGNHPAD